MVYARITRFVEFTVRLGRILVSRDL